MNFTREMIEKARSASSAEELLEMARAEGIEITEAEAAQYYDFLHTSRELTDEELSQVAGGLKSHEDNKCEDITLPSVRCTGSGFACGLDACKYYVETADPNSKATPYTYPVLCTCDKGHYHNVPMNRSYQA